MAATHMVQSAEELVELQLALQHHLRHRAQQMKQGRGLQALLLSDMALRGSSPERARQLAAPWETAVLQPHACRQAPAAWAAGGGGAGTRGSAVPPLMGWRAPPPAAAARLRLQPAAMAPSDGVRLRSRAALRRPIGGSGAASAAARGADAGFLDHVGEVPDESVQAAASGSGQRPAVGAARALPWTPPPRPRTPAAPQQHLRSLPLSALLPRELPAGAPNAPDRPCGRRSALRAADALPHQSEAAPDAAPAAAADPSPARLSELERPQSPSSGPYHGNQRVNGGPRGEVTCEDPDGGEGSIVISLSNVDDDSVQAFETNKEVKLVMPASARQALSNIAMDFRGTLLASLRVRITSSGPMIAGAEHRRHVTLEDAAGDKISAISWSGYATDQHLGDGYFYASNLEITRRAQALRVFAPSPPLDAAGLRGALDLFVEQLGVLKDPGSASFVQAYGLLERLAQTNAFALLFDCADPDGLLCAVVAACVEAARVNEAGRLDGLLGQVLAGVLDGSDGLPAAALSSLLLELSPQRSGSLARGLVCRTLRSLELRSASLSINDLVSSMLLQGRTSSEEVGSIGTAPDELEAVMGIVHELFAISPTLVTKALPNLRDDLRSPERLRRLLATRCVGRMLSQFHVSGASVVERPLCETYPLLLDSHLDRLDDADEEVRLAALEGAGAIISAACSLGASVVFNAEVSRGGGAAVAKAAESYREAVVGHYLDPSDTVRFRLIQIARDIALASEAGYEFLAPVLPNIFGRILDKRADIREESADAAARLYGKYAVPALTTCQYKVAERLAWVPQLICEAFSVFAGGRLGHTARLEEHIEQHLLGSSAGLEAPKRALTLAGFYCFASRHSTSRKGLMTLLSRKLRVIPVPVDLAATASEV
ncbi:unnamed protein product [Prorocentrum cordatum]|uniref:Sister chromatid cohesion protein n=1 Tax=Prorocentrum cordatum TaxID=2364126 RepID=A0ABN9QIG4_9DINO|nr:unnamed protein product [Polarella glacialis]